MGLSVFWISEDVPGQRNVRCMGDVALMVQSAFQPSRAVRSQKSVAMRGGVPLERIFVSSMSRVVSLLSSVKS